MPAIARRGFLLTPALAIVAAAQKFGGDTNWNENFRHFIKQLNIFMLGYNDGLLDAKQWKKVEEAWKVMEG